MEGRLHRNFQGYVSDASPYLIGLGASAIGRLKQGYVQNHPQIIPYRERIEAGTFAADKYYVLTPADRMRADIIERLMCDLRVDAGAIAKAHGLGDYDFSAAFAALHALEADGLVHVHGSHVRVMTPRAARLAAAAFDAYLAPEDNARRHTTSV
jgi:oxygen-independent coproporphyrinogen-3 oxidase